MRFHISKKFVLWLFVILLAFVITTVFLLENASKKMVIKSVPVPSCSEIVNAYKLNNPSSSFNFSNSSSVISSVPKLLSDLQNKRWRGEKISRSEYDEATKELVLKVRANAMGPLNGVACSNNGFVRDDLPSGASLFVRRYTLELLLGVKGGNLSTSATLAASKSHPIGLIETITFSLISRAKYYDSFTEYMVSGWVLFKRYFLPK